MQNLEMMEQRYKIKNPPLLKAPAGYVGVGY
jgi:hypothetical protein